MATEIRDGRNTDTADSEWDNDALDFTEGSNIYALMRALLSEADRIDSDLEDIKNAHHIDTATGKELEKLGQLVDLPRKQNESDDKYRARLKTQFRVGNIGSTFEDFAQFAAVMLDTDIDNIYFIFKFDVNPATVEVNVDPDIYESVALSKSEVDEFLGRAVPAGHAVNTTERGTFVLKTDGDADDPTKGLTSDSSSDGGTLAADLV